jgi:hypothetical protein
MRWQLPRRPSCCGCAEQAFYVGAACPPALPLVLSADGKGVAMHPEAMRLRRAGAGPRRKAFSKRLGSGE